MSVPTPAVVRAESPLVAALKILSPILAVAAFLWFQARPIGTADPAAPAPVVDAVAVKLGQDYRVAFDAAGLAALDAAVSSPGQTTAELARAQREALDAAVKAAGAPVVAELSRRFGPPSDVKYGAEVELPKIRAFYRDLAAGYRKGAR